MYPQPMPKWETPILIEVISPDQVLNGRQPNIEGAVGNGRNHTPFPPS